MADDRPPSGCRWCGIGERLHFDRWSDGWHVFMPPTDAQIFVRMKRRRQARGRPRPPRPADDA